jgi:hypothetical protein
MESDHGQHGIWFWAATGRWGGAVAQAFAAAGWRVLAQRHGAVAQAPLALPGMRMAVAPDAADTASCSALDEGARRGGPRDEPGATPQRPGVPRRPALMHQRPNSPPPWRCAHLLFPGNVYNFGAGMPAVLDAGHAAAPQHAAGPVRVALEQQLAQAVATQGLRAVIVRAGDFLARASGTWLDLVIARKLRQGVMTWPGPLDVPHAWAYLPDLAQAFVRVAEPRRPRAGALRVPALRRSHSDRARLAGRADRLVAGAGLVARRRAAGHRCPGDDAAAVARLRHTGLAAGHALPLGRAARAGWRGAGAAHRPRAPHAASLMRCATPSPSWIWPRAGRIRPAPSAGHSVTQGV